MVSRNLIELPVFTTGMAGQSRRLQVILGMRVVALDAEELSVIEAPIAMRGPHGDTLRFSNGQFLQRIRDRPDMRAVSWEDRLGDKLLYRLGFYDRQRNLINAYGKDRLHKLTASVEANDCRLRNIDDEEIRERNDDLIDEQICAFETFMQSAVLIGDGLYCPCPEPYLSLGRGGTGTAYACLSTRSFHDALNDGQADVISGFYPLTQSVLVRERLEAFYGSKSRFEIPVISIYEPDAFSRGFPMENAALMGQVMLQAFKSTMALPPNQSLPFLKEASPDAVDLLDTVSKTVEAYFADTSVSAPLFDLMSDILEFADDAPIWRLLRRDAAMSNTMDFVREHLEAMPIGLECFQ